MKKQILSLITAAAMMLTGTFTAFAVNYGEEYQSLSTPEITQTFSDVATTHWAFEYIGEMAQRGVASGYSDGRFLPENQVTRAEFAKMMVCAADLEIKTPVTVDGSNYEQYLINKPQGIGDPYGCVALSDGRFMEDVYFGAWYAPYVFTAANYMNFYEYNKAPYYLDAVSFEPYQAAVREDIAVALVKLKGYDVSSADESVLNMFEDSYSISSEARKYVAAAVEHGIVSGYEDNTFRGQATISRAEAATLLCMAFQYGNDNKVINIPSQTVDIPLYDVDELAQRLGTRQVYLYEEGGLLYGKYEQCEKVNTDSEYGVKYGDLTVLGSRALDGDIVQFSTTNPKTFRKNGVSLDKSYNELVTILGEPELGGPEQGIYWYTFVCDGYSLSFKFNDPAEAPYEVIVHY